MAETLAVNMKFFEFLQGFLGLILSIAGFIIGAAFIIWLAGAMINCLSWIFSGGK